ATTTKCVRIRASIISRRTSSWLKQQDQRPAMQRVGALRQMGPPRPGPLLNRPLGDNCNQRGKPSHTNDGPKNQGRSGLVAVEVHPHLMAELGQFSGVLHFLSRAFASINLSSSWAATYSPL